MLSDRLTLIVELILLSSGLTIKIFETTLSVLNVEMNELRNGLLDVILPTISLLSLTLTEIIVGISLDLLTRTVTVELRNGLLATT
ncbi:hypothetical protein D3C75_774050 [compost metagenome]